MRIGVCTLHGGFGEIHLHHISKDTTMAICPECHFRIHYPTTLTHYKKLPPELRFRLDMMAGRYDVESVGYYVSSIVLRLAKMELAESDQKVLEDICEFFGFPFEEVREIAKGTAL